MPTKPNTGGISELDILLRAAGLTRAQLSRRLGVKPSTISRWGGVPPQYARAYLELKRDVSRAAK